SGVEHLSYFSSTASSTGALSITVTFDPGTNVDQAVFNVNNRVQIALPRLPDEVRRNGVIVQKRSFDILNVVTLSSPTGARDTLFLSNYASINLVDELKRLPGLADVTVFGARDYSMRVWLNTEKMARLGVTPSDVAGALRAQNAQYAAGKIGTEPAPPGQAVVYTVTAIGRLVDPEQFGDIVVRASFNNAGPGGVLRLRDIARIELGALNYDTYNTIDGKPAIGMATFLQPGANALEVAQLVRQRMAELKAGFPEGVDYAIPFDTTRFVDASIREVVKTIFEAAVLVLCAVFVPVAFLGGIAGQLYRQFALTLTFAVAISGFMALTLTPALCALLMKPGEHHETRIFRPFNRGFAWLTRRFLWAVNLALAHRIASPVAFLLCFAITIGLFLRIPGSFVPPEDQ